MKLKKMIAVATIAAMLTGCSSGGNITLTTAASASTPATVPTIEDSSVGSGELDIKFTNFDLSDETPSDAVSIELSDGGSVCTNEGVSIESGVIRITAGGDYIIRGSLSSGRLIVEVGKDEKVRLCLDGVSITSESAPIEMISADKVLILLCEGSENTITDNGSGYVDSDDDTSAENDENARPTAAIYSKCALTIGGKGTLVVNASYHDGIRSKKTLKIVGGNLSVGSVGTAVKGSNGVAIADGKIELTADENCIRTSEEEDTTKGYVYIKGGTLELSAKKHGISASRYVIVEGGEIDITTTGTEVDSDSNDSSGGGMWGRPGGFGNEGSGLAKIKSKGIKADVSVSVSGGSININSTGHAISSGGAVSISGDDTKLTLYAKCSSPSANSKGIKADGDLLVSGGSVNVKYSYEGLESKGGVINISGGSVGVYSTDDGFNASSNDGSIVIGGGNIFVNASGDGFDSNGNIYFTGGTTLIAGPTTSADGALDCGDNRNYIAVSGGTLIAYGAAGMAEAPTAEYSTQCSISTNITITEGSLCALTDSDGNAVCAFVAAESAQNVVISSPDIQIGSNYSLVSGGTLDGASDTDKIYSGGKVDGGNTLSTFTVSSILTGSSGGMGGIGGIGGGGFGGGGFGGGGGMGGHGGDFGGDKPNDPGDIGGFGGPGGMDGDPPDPR